MADFTMRVLYDRPMSDPYYEAFLVPWAEAIEAQSGGIIEVQVYGAGFIVAADDTLLAVQDGIADAALVTLDASVDPRFELFALPFTLSSDEASARTAWTVFDRHFSDAVDGVRVLSTHIDRVAQLQTTFAVDSPDDLAGVRLAHYGGVTSENLLGGLQVSTVDLPLGEIAGAVQRDTLDGAALPFDLPPRIFHLDDNSRSLNHFLGFHDGYGLSSQLSGIVVADAFYDQLPPDLKAVIDANSGIETSAAGGRAGDTAENALIPALHDEAARVGADITVTQLSAGQTASWEAAAQAHIDATVTALSSGGFAAADVLSQLEEEAGGGGSPVEPGDTTGTAGDDTLTGSAGDDTVLATSGSDAINGAAGNDAVVYGGARAGFGHELEFDGTIVISKPGGSTDTLIAIERVSFSDGDLLYSIGSPDGDAAYRLYGGAFDRVPDEAGLRFWIDAVTGGTTLEQTAAGFIDSQEFTALYGGNLGNAEFVDQLYLNVLGRSGEEDGVTFWNDYLDDGGDRAVTLVQFTQLPEYVGLSQADIENGYWVL